jgi:two-component sensor histidine kinase
MSEQRSPADDARIAEARHRMANSYQLMGALARMRAQRTAEPAARRDLIWMADAVGALGALDRRAADGGVDFADYLNEMCAVWRRRHNAQAPEIRLDCEALLAPHHATSALALIAHELVANALTHGLAERPDGQVSVALRRRDDGQCELTVADGGQGFDLAAAAAEDRFGLWLVRNLTTQLRGAFSAGPAGVTLVFPL